MRNSGFRAITTLAACAGLLWSQFAPTLPALPTATVDTSMPVRTGALTPVHAGGNLTTIMNAAACGDWLVLDAGAVFTGNFHYLNSCTAANPIVIISSGLLPVPGNRITPSAQASQMATIQTNSALPAFYTAANSGGLRLIGIEFRQATGQTSNNYAVCLGQCGFDATQRTSSNREKDLLMDRCWVHGDGDYTHNLRHAVDLACRNCGVVDSYINNIWAPALGDSQAILAYDAEGPLVIHNNGLSAASENIDFGGALPSYSGVIPSDITITGNYLWKDPNWKGQIAVKNLWECKSCQRVLVEGNVMDYNWASAQDGTALELTVRTSQSGSWAVVNDLTFRNNLIRHTDGGWKSIGWDDADPNADKVNSHARRFLFQNNIFGDINNVTWGSGLGQIFLAGNNTTDVTMRHNTFELVASTATTTIVSTDTSTRFFIENNIFGSGTYGIHGNAGDGITALNTWVTWWWNNNVQYNFAGTLSAYPTGNFYPSTESAVGFTNSSALNYTLLSTSPYFGAATDGGDIGANVAVVNAATANVISGQTADPYGTSISGSVTVSGKVVIQ